LSGENPADIPLHPDETLDELRLGGLRIIQKKNGYRFSVDPVLLCAFGHLRRGETVADLGTGSGVLPLLLAERSAAGGITGIELQPSLADCARRNVRLNGMENRVRILEGDLRRLNLELYQRFDAVFANPPFRKPETGRKSPDPQRAGARHELSGCLEDFLKTAFLLLKDGGRFYLVFPAERLAELLEEVRRERLEPKRLRCVHSRQGESAKLVLVEGRKRGRTGMVVDSPLVLYEGAVYSPEVLAIYGEGRPG